ncbi:MAG: 16S rRNA (cytosine(1402)-N(4))-methyltransferase RsmH [Candidatus Cloacimonetes bacterium]|nr:16S rRNA (cytosine(1402)-N(4))-methyltransferase RsmH [Candidatus Cloacimonadota bacterium]
MSQYHQPVLLNESVQAITRPGNRLLVDGTLGGGGHSRLLLDTNPDATVIAFDRDMDALAYAREELAGYGERFVTVHDNFANMRTRLALLGIGRIDGLILDLGVSSHQIDTSERGFSWRDDGPLDMRMNAGDGPTAADIVNDRSVEELARVLFEYGDERASRRIARAIVKARPLHTTTQLADVVQSVTRAQHPLKSCARVFQALRIAINGELEALEIALRDGVRLLTTGGRVAVISYHSLEDRIVKHFFRYEASDCDCPPGLPSCCCGKHATLELITRKPLVPSPEETTTNSRARSARLRVAAKLSGVEA